jgi:hypothetical protein
MMAGKSYIDFQGAHADYSLSDDEAIVSNIQVANNNAASNLILQKAIPGWVWVIYNSGLYAVTFKVIGQTGVTIQPGMRMTMNCSDSDIVPMSPEYYYASHDYAGAHADWVMSAQEQMASFVELTNAAGGGANMILGAAIPGNIYLVNNQSGQTVTFKVAGQSGGTVATGKVREFACGLTDIVAGPTT